MEWIPFVGSWNSFVTRDLAIPGTAIKLNSGEVLLIGDINSIGGCCECCAGVETAQVIEGYAVVWNGDTK